MFGTKVITDTMIHLCSYVNNVCFIYETDHLNEWFSTGAMPYLGGATGRNMKNWGPWKLLSGPRKFHF